MALSGLTQEPVEQNVEQTGLRNLGRPVCRGLEVTDSSIFRSNLGRHRALADHLHILKQALDTLGTPNCAIVICRAGGRRPRATQVETICASTAAQFILPPMSSLREPLTEEDGNAEGYTTNELALRHLGQGSSWRLGIMRKSGYRHTPG